MSEDQEIIERYKNRLGLFSILTYTTKDSEKEFTAFGQILQVTEEGKLILKNQNNGAESELDLISIKIVSAKFEPYREVNHENKNNTNHS